MQLKVFQENHQTLVGFQWTHGALTEVPEGASTLALEQKVRLYFE